MYFNYNRYKADQSYDDYVETEISDQNIKVEVTKKGEILIDGKISDRKLNSIPNYDELRIPIVDQPGQYFDKIIIELKIPDNSAYEVEHQMLAIHGVDKSTSYILNNSTLIYEAVGVSSTATLSVVAKIPNGIINKPFYIKLFSKLSTIRFNFWLALAVILPLFTFIFMLIFISKKGRGQKVEKPDQAISSPPMAIPPALVGVLYHGKVGPREVAATLIDLAQRKDIYILDKDRGFSFGKGKFDNRLLSYEKILLSKIFKNNLSTSRIEIEKKVSEKLYSKKMSVVTAGIYTIATRLGYFQENPRKVYSKYQLASVLSFLLGIAGFIGSFLYDFLPTFTSLFWLGMICSSIIIFIFAYNAPVRTEIGTETLSNWLAFQMFLSDPAPIAYSSRVHQLFETYLPYAIVLDCEAAWARRFSGHNFIVPDWFVSSKSGLGINDFCLSLFPIVSYVGRNLTELREPGYK